MDEQLMAVVDSARRASLHVTASQTSSSARDSDLYAPSPIPPHPPLLVTLPVPRPALAHVGDRLVGGLLACQPRPASPPPSPPPRVDTAQALAVVPAWRSADMRVRLTAMRLDALVAKICDPDFDDADTVRAKAWWFNLFVHHLSYPPPPFPLLYHHFYTQAQLQTFLLTHTNFMTSSALLAFLADRVTLAGAEADAVAARVSTVFSFWASAYAYDFEDGSLDSGVARLAATHGYGRRGAGGAVFDLVL